jgi:hypothetical protein
MKSMTGYGEASQNIHAPNLRANSQREPSSSRSASAHAAKCLSGRNRKLLHKRFPAAASICSSTAMRQGASKPRWAKIDRRGISGVAQIRRNTTWRWGDVAGVQHPRRLHVREVEIDSNNERQASKAPRARSKSSEPRGLRTDMESQIAHLRKSPLLWKPGRPMARASKGAMGPTARSRSEIIRMYPLPSPKAI